DFIRLIEGTLKKSAKTIRLTSYANIGVLFVGVMVLVTSVVLSVKTPSWPNIALGGLGLGGVVTSLVSSPLAAFALGARRMVQIQIAYFGFINQISLIKSSAGRDEESTPLERSARLQEVIRTMTEDLTRLW